MRVVADGEDESGNESGDDETSSVKQRAKKKASR
jgi:hypothetical protein